MHMPAHGLFLHASLDELVATRSALYLFVEIIVFFRAFTGSLVSLATSYHALSDKSIPLCLNASVNVLRYAAWMKDGQRH